MTPAVAHLLEKAGELSSEERADLIDGLLVRLHSDPDPDVLEAQMIEVRRRIAQVRSGEATLIPGDEALAEVRRMVGRDREAS